MAQFFYDLSICKPNKWPYGFQDVELPEKSSVAPSAKGHLLSGFAAASTYRFNSIDQVSNDSDVLYVGTNDLMKQTVAFANSGPVCIFARGSGPLAGTGRPPTCYYATVNSLTDGIGRTLRIYKLVATDDSTQIGVLENAFPVADMDQSKLIAVRLNCTGSLIRAKVWDFSQPEPTAWGITVTDTAIASGRPGMVYSLREGLTRRVSFSFGTNGDSAPSSYPGGNRVVAGTLLKPDGSPADGYIVRCYHRATGIMLGEVLSNAIGAFNFSLPISQSEKVYCVGVDQLGNTWNAPIKDLIAPVSP